MSWFMSTCVCNLWLTRESLTKCSRFFKILYSQIKLIMNDILDHYTFTIVIIALTSVLIPDSFHGLSFT